MYISELKHQAKEIFREYRKPLLLAIIPTVILLYITFGKGIAVNSSGTMFSAGLNKSTTLNMIGFTDLILGILVFIAEFFFVAKALELKNNKSYRQNIMNNIGSLILKNIFLLLVIGIIYFVYYIFLFLIALLAIATSMWWLMIICALLGTGVLIFIMINLSQVTLIFMYSSAGILDIEYLSIRRAISLSSKLINGYRIKYILMTLSFILWFLTIPLTFGLSAFFVYPYFILTQMVFFESLFEKE
jgi:hypothetical membrane protein